MVVTLGSSKTTTYSSASARITLVFPTEWDTTLANFISEPEFNAILTELGRLAAADGNLEQEIFDGVSYLVDTNDFRSAVEYVDNELRNSFHKRKALLLVLHRSKLHDLIKQAELEDILTGATTWHDERNKYVHARWCIPDKKAGGVICLKFDAAKKRDQVRSVKPSDLHKVATGVEDYTSRLRTHFLGTFVDYRDWLEKRMPLPGTPATPIGEPKSRSIKNKKKK